VRYLKRLKVEWNLEWKEEFYEKIGKTVEWREMRRGCVCRSKWS